jgi:DNA-binding transcriptional MerR regulator
MFEFVGLHIQDIQEFIDRPSQRDFEELESKVSELSSENYKLEDEISDLKDEVEDANVNAAYNEAIKKIEEIINDLP